MHNTSGSTPQSDAPSRHIQTPDDEIDLIEVARSLWASRALIIAITVVVTLLAGIYAFTATPTYQVKSVLRAAQSSDLALLNGTEHYSLAPADALQRIGRDLESYDTRWTFYRDNIDLFAGLYEDGMPLEQSFEHFNEKAFKVIWPSQKRNDNEPLRHQVEIQMDYPADLNGETILNRLIAYAIQRETQRIRNDFIGVLETRDAFQRQALKDELTALRLQLKTHRLNRIDQLNEARSIAQSLNITKPTTPSGMTAQPRSSSSGNVILTEVSNQQTPLYFMGTEALTAERDALNARESDDFTSPRIAEILKELELLKVNRRVAALKTSKSSAAASDTIETTQVSDGNSLEEFLGSRDVLRLVRIDQPAQQPLNPIKPRKTLILAIGLVLGGMLGVMIALLRMAFSNSGRTR